MLILRIFLMTFRRSEKDQFIPSGGYKADRFTEKVIIYLI